MAVLVRGKITGADLVLPTPPRPPYRSVTTNGARLMLDILAYPEPLQREHSRDSRAAIAHAIPLYMEVR